jgi:hypothetical protein
MNSRADADTKQEELRLMVGYVDCILYHYRLDLYNESIANGTVTFCKLRRL